MSRCDVAILGAGPYGLSAAAHLRCIKGLDVRSFGAPMSFWERNMPVGMLLRSGWAATHIADPTESLTLDAYKVATRSQFSSPVPLDNFFNYGLWYQQQAIPDLDPAKIIRIESRPEGFGLLLAGGEMVLAKRVVIAAGISSFAWRPAEFANIPDSLASHTSKHREFAKLAGKEVLVVGSGQSALESAALLHEGGTQVEIVARTHQIRWLGGLVSRTIHSGLGPLLSRLLYAPTDIGPAGISHIVARPDLVRTFPRFVQDWLKKRSIRPAGARWLINRLKDVPARLGTSVVSATPFGSRIRVKLSDGSERTVDHVLLGTGYRVDVAKYDFFAPELARSIKQYKGYPELREGFETSVPGLHILGAPAVWSFGPLMQFVVGTHYASRALLDCIAQRTSGNQKKIPAAEPMTAEVG